MNDQGRPRFGASLSFRSGLLAGVLIVPVVVFTLAAFHFVRKAPMDAPNAPTVDAAGTPLSASGGRTLVLRNGYDTITLTCRGTCDDLNIRDNDTQYGTYDARVTDGRGVCLSCGPVRSRRKGGRLEVVAAGGAIIMTAPDFSD